nr:APC family permease [Specibacter cremeus]
MDAQPGPAGVAGTGLRRVLSVPALVLFGLAYMVPLTVFTTYGIVNQITDGRLPLAYIVTLVTMIFTTISYGSMVRAYPVAGSAYAYASRVFGPKAGFLSGWSLLLDYMLLPMINYLIIGIWLGQTFPAVPTWVFVLAAIILVTLLNLLGIVHVARANMVIVGAQAVFIVVFVVMALLALNSGTNFLAPFTGTGAGGISPLFAGAAVLCLSFLGFDAVSTLAEETKNARRDVPRAILLVTLIAGALFVVLSYLSYLVLPTTNFHNVDSASLEVMAKLGGDFLVAFFTAAFVAGSFGSAVASQASVSRILYSMGREGVLPRAVFGRLSVKGAVPVLSILVVAVVSLLALVTSLDVVASMISFGALVAFSVVNLAVIRHYLFVERRRGAKSMIVYGAVPTIGFLLTAWLWTSLSQVALTVGLGWVAVGIIILAITTRGFRKASPSWQMDEAL